MNRGDLSKPEAMLTNHSTALQGLFSRLAERAMAHNTIPGFYANMRMALRVRAQCRTTLEALAAIKNPPMVYARQANVTTGLSTTEGKARVSRNAYKGGRERYSAKSRGGFDRCDHLARPPTAG